MSEFNVTAPVALICRGRGEYSKNRPYSTAVVAAIAVAVALVGSGLYSAVYADSPTEPTQSSQSSGAASQELRRYTLQLLRILSAPDANQWERYRQAMPHCAAASTRLAEIGSGNDVGPLDAALIALTEDLCADLDRRLDEARTVGLLVNEPESMNGYVLIPGNANNDVHLIDHLGRIAHSWQLGTRIDHARLLDNGNLLVNLDRIVTEIDPDSNIVWQYAHPDGTHHHDFLKMPNGNVLILMLGVKTPEEVIALGVDPDIVSSSEGMDYDYLIEVRPSGSEGGEIVWEWSALDYIVQDFDPAKPNYGDPYEHPELIDANFSTGKYFRSPVVNVLLLTYINAIDYNPELDQIALSARHYSELWIIDHSATAEEAPARKGGNAGRGGALLYRWGNPRAYQHGTVDDQRLFRQHHTHWIAPGLPGAGNILVFNNGYELGVTPPYYSSIEEIVPPVDGYGYRREPGKAYPPVEPVWSYTAETPTDFYSVVISGVQRLPNGNTLICEGVSGNLFQVTPEGKTVWKYVYPMDANTPLKQGDALSGNYVYRAYWYAPDHPGLQHYDLTPGDTIELYE